MLQTSAQRAERVCGGSPHFLPDGRQFLFLAGAPDTSDAAIYEGSLGSTEVTRLVASGSNPVYADPGYLLFHRQGTLWAQAFDPGRRDLSGEPMGVA